ncbi:hypothetical protein H072_7790 [Dactylellina haptotyla CBS 200.50]|uniref:F-box domain-containing protein n=1 Tax=Dactylellina haptotyla (strain CBS 200.50) TaxID=1284197 RepID=S8BTC2_DACHA|nr:hypothetical protein H072_7790 [Dactylellina haptotyla CBS 200.50]
MAIHLLNILSLSNPILYTAIFDYLEPQDTLRLLRTCKALYEFKYELWSINRSLRRFVDDPIAFRSLMARYNAIVSGSHALQFLARIKWPKSDLDLYVTEDGGIAAFASHLVAKEGYSYQAYSWQSADFETAYRNRVQEADAWVAKMSEQLDENGQGWDPADDTASEAAWYTLKEIVGVYNFVHDTYPNRRVQLIATKVTPINGVLAGYYATHIFNFFTWNKAYSLFPYHTFSKNESFYTNSLTKKSYEAVEKYYGRGYEFNEYGDYHKCIANCPLRPHRRVADRYSWVLDLDTTGINSSDVAVPTSVIDMVSWGMKMHYSYWNRDTNSRVFHAFNIHIVYTYDVTGAFRHPRIYDRHTSSLFRFLEDMKRSMKRLEVYNYKVGFPGSKLLNYNEEGNIYLDDQFEDWYRFWEKSIMPYENMWVWQYPMLGGFETSITNAGVPCDQGIGKVEEAAKVDDVDRMEE